MNDITTSKKEIVMFQPDDAIRLENVDIESLIRTIRGQKVMVDFDLAMLYGVQNKRLNEQVKRNIKRFPDDFMFQLSQDEWNILRSQFATTKDISKIRTLPYAFTREGIGMLSSVLISFNCLAKTTTDS